MSLLEAQAAVGSIADPMTGEHVSVNEALERQLLDKQFAAVLGRAERAVTGFRPKGSDETLSLFQAMKRVSQRFYKYRYGSSIRAADRIAGDG